MTNSDFDWVNARLDCSAAKVFQRLRLEVESDVEIRNFAIPLDAKWQFDTVSQGGRFTVFVKGRKSAIPSVVFAQTEVGISVHDENGKSIVDATLTLSDEGQCRLKIDGQEHESWQLRRMALEDLFFGDPGHS